MTTSTPWLVRMIEEQFHRDDEDRLIREGRTPAQFIRPGEIEYKTCPYPGTRHQHACPMNVSALRQMSAHWDDVLDACAVMRAAYVEGRGASSSAGELPELIDVWRIGQLGSALPWFYLLRGEGAPTPAYAAGLAKITLGVGLWAQQLLVLQLAGSWTPVPLTPQAIYESTEATGALIGATEVCTGPEKMMLRFFEALVAGVPQGTSPAIARLVAERDRAVLFGAHYANAKLVLWIHFLARRFVYADLALALGEAADLTELTELTELRDGACEPPDFFVVGPPDLAAVAPASRALWIGTLAKLVAPMAPDHSDAPLQATVLAIGLALGTTAAPPAVTDEIARRHHVSPEAAERAASAIATYARLDAILGEVAATVEDGFRRADPSAGPATRFDAGLRDRLLVQPPRAVLARLAPEAIAALCPA